jgi:uncharacterized damage-inducible protein DinB
MRRVPYTGSEKDSLYVSLDRHRDVVLWKLEGLDDEQLRRSMTPTGTNLLGLVKHLASVEYGWFCETFGRKSEAIPFDEADPDADMRAAPNETTADIIDYYRRALGQRMVRRPGLAALGADPHDRGDCSACRAHGHPA